MNLRETLVSVLEEFDPGGWYDDPRIDGWVERINNTSRRVRLADLDASEYDDLIVETMAARNDALLLLKQIEDLNEEAHRDDWSALGLYSGIRALLKRPCPHDPGEWVSDGETRWCGECGKVLAAWDEANGWVGA